ncbi:hypothetical protein CPB84DRAFT_1793547 [Gymnopilus junonius]|uniref:Uncharacterized protein n=1 Tax=Gymnopilus junonius TaxID=109634 RepID=A0A9P5NDL0_GYMJU|nr:hypothetical protein CPB84DRAFT_1793547 [Gymnopilus junonius]
MLVQYYSTTTPSQTPTAAPVEVSQTTTQVAPLNSESNDVYSGSDEGEEPEPTSRPREVPPKPTNSRREKVSRSYTTANPIISRTSESKKRELTIEQAKAELAKLKAADEARKRAELRETGKKKIYPSSKTPARARVEEEEEEEEEDTQQSSPDEWSDVEEEVEAPSARAQKQAAKQAAERSRTMPASRQYQDSLSSQFAGMGLNGAGPSLQPQYAYPPVPPPHMAAPFYGSPAPYYGGGVPVIPPYGAPPHTYHHPYGAPPGVIHNTNSGNVTHSTITDIGNDHSVNYSPTSRRSKKAKGATVDSVNGRIMDHLDATLGASLRR